MGVEQVRRRGVAAGCRTRAAIVLIIAIFGQTFTLNRGPQLGTNPFSWERHAFHTTLFATRFPSGDVVGSKSRGLSVSQVEKG